MATSTVNSVWKSIGVTLRRVYGSEPWQLYLNIIFLEMKCLLMKIMTTLNFRMSRVHCCDAFATLNF